MRNLNRGLEMRCLSCRTVVDDKYPYCPVCKKPAARPSKWRGPKGKTTSCSLIFLIIGIAVFNTFAPRWFPRPSAGGINYEMVFWAGVVGAGSALVGGLVGACLGGPQRQ